MAGRKPKGKRKGRGFWARLFRWIGRKSIRGIRRRLRRARKGIASIFEAKVVKSYKRDHWREEFPDPRRPAPLVMTKRENTPEHREEYTATFDGELSVEFWIHHDSGVALIDAAYGAAEEAHGPIAQSWVLTAIEGTNDPGRAVLSGLPGGMLKR